MTVEKPTGLRFDATINLGMMIQFISIAALMVGGWINFNNRITVIEVQHAQMISDMAKTAKENKDSIDKIGATTDRIERFMIHKYPDYYALSASRLE
jgi:hypothetical protein